MTVEGVQRDLGRMEAQICALTRQVAELNKQVGTIQTTLSEARGGWRTLAWIAGASGAIGSGLTYLASFFHMKF